MVNNGATVTVLPLAIESAQRRAERLECEHAEELAGLRRQHDAEGERRRAQYADPRERLAAAGRALESFKVRVRERALECKADEGWCDEGFNAAMRDLGLPELSSTYLARVSVYVRVVNAESESVAREWIGQALDSTDSDVTIRDWDVDELYVQE